ncbi:MAG: Crp/Fnr family transcriptional regulator [Lachnospiraceae bacterium]|nr:Crp/Fnr family transcriptional regulator [Lachnospiraceae bacterium]
MEKNLIKLLGILEKDKDIFQLLRQCPYEILREFQVMEYNTDEFELEQGEIHNTFYIIVSGYADVYTESEHGKKYQLCTYEKGDYIGELEIFQQKGYISKVQGRGKVVLLELDRPYFMKWIRLDKNFNEYMIRTLCNNSYRMCMNMGHNTLYTLKQRICQYLTDNSGRDGKLKSSISSEILSQQMAVTPRSVNRVLKELKEKNIITLNKGNIVIEDYDALKEQQESR